MKNSKLKLSIFFLFLLLINLNLYAELSGSYTIGKGGDFPTISKAVDSLNSAGRSGSISFYIIDGTYKEQFTIQRHRGMSSSNSVLFVPKSGNPGSVKVVFASTSNANNFIVKLEDVSDITFEKISFISAGTNFGTIISFSGTSNESIIFRDNFFQGVKTRFFSKDFNIIHAENSNTFQTRILGNTFVNGSKAIFMKGSGLPSDNTIVSNTISGGTSDAVYLENQKSPFVSQNIISHTSFPYAIHLKACKENLRVINNKINISDLSRAGIYLNGCDGSAQSRGLLANNFITVGHFDGGRSGIEITKSKKLDIYYNSINVNNPNHNSQAFYLTDIGSEDINIVNNNFSNTGHSFRTNLPGGRAIWIDDPNAVAVMENNNIFSTGNYIAKWGDSNFLDLKTLELISGKNTNSISVFPHYAASTNLHTISPYLDGAAAALTGVTVDIDGHPRDASAPDIGADEFTLDPANKIPLSGTYTIGSGKDYPNFTDAAADLLLKGMSSSVIFDVIPGKYNENFTLFEVPMKNKSDSIVFKSKTGNPEDVKLSYDANSADNNYIINLRAAKNIIFKNLTISSNTSALPGPIFVIQGYNKNIKFLNNLLNGTSTNLNTPGNALIYADPALTKNIVISGNTFTGGSYGVYMYGFTSNSFLSESSVIVENNFFSASGDLGIKLNDQTAPIISKNIINNGIYLNFCNGAIKITQNMIDVHGIHSGIFLVSSGVEDLSNSRGIVANNFVTHRGGGDHITRGAVEIYANQKIDVVYNSVNSESPLLSSLFIWESEDGIDNDYDINVINNLLINKGKGYAYYVMAPSAIKRSDNNDIYTTGEKFAYWDGERANLTELQAASGKDPNSISADPGFVSVNDLHASAKALDSAGISLAFVADDIDGELRDVNNPDIGADEFFIVFNNPPSITSEPDTFASVGSLYEYQVTTEDIEKDTITYSLTTVPGFLSIDSKSGLLQGTPSLNDTGKHPVEIIADDNKGNQVKQNFILSVDNTTAINSSSNKIPHDYFISQNYPNPFNPTTTIRYGVPFNSHVKIEVFNITGKRILNLVDEKKAAGSYEVMFNSSHLSSGIYFYRIKAGTFNHVKKMILLK